MQNPQITDAVRTILIKFVWRAYYSYTFRVRYISHAELLTRNIVAEIGGRRLFEGDNEK